MPKLSKPGGRHGRPSAKSRSIVIGGTTVRLDDQLWQAMRDIAKRERCSISELCTAIAERRSHALNVTAALRLFMLLYYKAAATEEGHRKAGHGGFDHVVLSLTPASH